MKMTQGLMPQNPELVKCDVTQNKSDEAESRAGGGQLLEAVES
jgi:hypothetical protein